MQSRMALSNWDLMAVNAKGEPTNGIFVSKSKVTVEIYKNWIYIRDPEAWRDGGPYVNDTVAQVNDGNLQYKDVHIAAKRGPKNGIYAVVTSKRYDHAPPKGCKHCGRKSEPGKKGEKEFHAGNCPVVFDAMLGIGCYAYEGDKFVGVTQKEVKFLKDWVNESWKSKMNLAGSVAIQTDPKTGKTRRWKPKPKWHHYTDYAFSEEIRSIPLGKVLRFNQGDAFFARNLKFDVPATKPGKGKDTIMMKALKGAKKD